MIRTLTYFSCLLLALSPTLLAFPLDGGPAVFDEVFDSYGDIDWQLEKARLDNFAFSLQRNPSYVGYILVYAGRLACRGEARARAERRGT
jgi:hypothetical protein